LQRELLRRRRFRREQQQQQQHHDGVCIIKKEEEMCCALLFCFFCCSGVAKTKEFKVPTFLEQRKNFFESFLDPQNSLLIAII
jgi:hypothetical protein